MPEELRIRFYKDHDATTRERAHYRHFTFQDLLQQQETNQERALDYIYGVLREDPTNPIFYEKLIEQAKAMHKNGIPFNLGIGVIRHKTNKLFAAAMAYKDPRLRVVNKVYDNTRIAISFIIQRTENREISRKRHVCARFVEENKGNEEFSTLESRGFVEFEGRWYSVLYVVMPRRYEIAGSSTDSLLSIKLNAQTYTTFLEDKGRKEKKEAVKRAIDSLVNLQEIFRVNRSEARRLNIGEYNYRNAIEKFIKNTGINFGEWEIIEFLEKRRKVFGHCDFYLDNLVIADSKYPCIIDFAKASWVNDFFDLTFLFEQKNLDFRWRDKEELIGYYSKKLKLGGDLINLYFHNALIINLLGIAYQKTIGERDGYYLRGALEIIKKMKRKGIELKSLESELHGYSGFG